MDKILICAAIKHISLRSLSGGPFGFLWFGEQTGQNKGMFLLFEYMVMKRAIAFVLGIQVYILSNKLKRTDGVQNSLGRFAIPGMPH